MELKFALGSAETPLGHAMIYFTSAGDPDGPVMVSYVLVLPIKMDLQRYIPQFLAGQIKDIVPSDMSLVVLPPVPEKFGRMEDLLELAERRGDDLLYGGDMSSEGGISDMSKAGEIGRSYMELCKRWRTDGVGELEDDDSGLVLELGDVLKEDASEEEGLQEVSRLLGKLRYAVEGGDANEVERIKGQIEAIGQTLPARFAVDKMVQFGAKATATAGKLAQLYLERAFCIQSEEYLKVKEIEQQIGNLETG